MSTSGKKLTHNKYVLLAPSPTALTMNGNIMYCYACNKKINFSQKSHVEVHVKSQLHIKSKANWIAMKKQQQKQVAQEKEESKDVNEYYLELCEALLAADIPIAKLGNENFSQFLSKYTGRKTPHESTLRKNYVSKVYQKVMAAIRVELGDLHDELIS